MEECCNTPPNTYSYGSLPTVQGIFTQTEANVTTNVDPAVVSLTVVDPDGNTNTYVYGVSAIAKVSTGVYQFTINANLRGQWFYRWYSAAPDQASGDQLFEVESDYPY